MFLTAKTHEVRHRLRESACCSAALVVAEWSSLHDATPVLRGGMVRRSAGERERGREGKREGGTPPKDPKVAQDRHKLAQDGPRVAPTWPTIAQDAPKMPREDPKMTQDTAKRAQDNQIDPDLRQ